MYASGFHFLHKGNIDVYSENYIFPYELYVLRSIAYGTVEWKIIK